MEAADPIAVSLDATLPLPKVVDGIDLETMFELSEVLYELPEDLRTALDSALSGGMNLIQIVALGAKLAWRLAPDALGMLLARLICTSGERPADGGFGGLAVDIDLDAMERNATTAMAVAAAGTGPSIEVGD